jgi:hypothetical protein
MAGYSGNPLPKKLGIKEDMTVWVLGAPDGFAATFGELPDGVVVHDRLTTSNILVVFSRWSDELKAGFHAAMAHIPPDGAIWVAWPRRPPVWRRI